MSIKPGLTGGIDGPVGGQPVERPHASDRLALDPQVRDLIDAPRWINDPAIGDAEGVHGAIIVGT